MVEVEGRVLTGAGHLVAEKVMFAGGLRPGIEVEGFDPFINECVACAINEGHQLFTTWGSEDLIQEEPEIRSEAWSFFVAEASSDELMRAGLLIAALPAGAVVKTEDGYRFTVGPDGIITDGDMDFSSLDQLDVGFTLTCSM